MRQPLLMNVRRMHAFSTGSLETHAVHRRRGAAREALKALPIRGDEAAYQDVLACYQIGRLVAVRSLQETVTPPTFQGMSASTSETQRLPRVSSVRTRRGDAVKVEQPLLHGMFARPEGNKQLAAQHDLG